MDKKELLAYLNGKQQLTSEVDNARHALSTSENDLGTLKKKFKRYFIIMFLLFLVAMSKGFLLTIRFIGLIALIYLRITRGSQLKSTIQNEQHDLDQAESSPDYLKETDDFPNEFYSYWTIDRLIGLVKENRAITLREAFNIAETQDFQNDQLTLQQKNLAVAKSTKTMASISAMANVGTFFNTRRK